jgi:alpha-glucosidase
LAAQIVFFSPLQFVLWYDSPVHYQGEPEIGLMGALPAVWDETVVLDGAIGDYIVVARRQGEQWFVGAMTDEQVRTLTLNLSFLQPDRLYHAQI